MPGPRRGAFSGKVVLVTGAGRGSGRALVEAFAREGARVAANDIVPTNLISLLASVQAAGGEARPYVFDVAMRMQAQVLVEEIMADWGRLDILVNHAAVDPHDGLFELDEWDWRRALDVNLSAPFFLIQAAAGVMRRQGGGIVVLLGAELPGGGIAYQASKEGLLGLTRAAAQEAASGEMRVEILHPKPLDPAATPEQRDRRNAVLIEQVFALCLGPAQPPENDR